MFAGIFKQCLGFACLACDSQQVMATVPKTSLRLRLCFSVRVFLPVYLHDLKSIFLVNSQQASLYSNKRDIWGAIANAACPFLLVS